MRDPRSTPSGPPIRSSWAIPPLVVKAPPTTSRIECRRPLASERVTRSPARRPGADTRVIPWIQLDTGEPPYAQLPARAEGVGRRLHSRGCEQMLVGLAHRQQHTVAGRLALQAGHAVCLVRFAAARLIGAFEVHDRAGAGRRRSIEVGLRQASPVEVQAFRSSTIKVLFSVRAESSLNL